MLSLSEMALLRRSPAALPLLASVAAGRSPVAALDRLVPRSGYATQAGIAYGSGPRQKLDLYRPEGRPEGRTGPLPVVVFLYGGGWNSGERANYRFVGQALASRGYLAAIPDYRLYPQVRFPAFVEDAAAAVAWARAHAARHGGDPERIALVGHSAGAHIAALLATDAHWLGAAGVPRAALRAMVGLAGPYAFNPLDYGRTRAIFEGLADIDRARPIAAVDGGEPPALLLHGLRDETVHPEQSALFARRIEAAGGRVRTVTYAGLGHIGIVLALAAPFQAMAPVLDEADRFIAAAAGAP